MTQWILSGNSIAELTRLPETGMGFQLVSGTLYGSTAVFLVLNAEIAFDLSQVELLSSDQPAAVLANGLRILNAMQLSGPPIIGRPEPHSFALVGARIAVSTIATSPPSSASPSVTLPSSLVKNSVLSANRVFHRYSAFNPDRRVNAVTGDFLPGTYCVPESEVPFIPTGFAAVGRLALPNLSPASHQYVIEAPAGTAVSFGTVAPAFGQAGGGVEALLPAGAKNQSVPAIAPSVIPDE